MKPYQKITPEIREIIIEKLGHDCVISDPDQLETYNCDASEIRHTPELVVCPKTVAQIQDLMILAGKYRFPVTPRGGGSGLAGACLPALGGVVLSMTGLNNIRSIDKKNLILEVEAGAISKDVRDRAAAVNLFYPPDPAGMDKSTIGGNAATDAGGPACVKYGTTRDYILGLEAVLPDGSLIQTGVKTRKGVVGYDMTNLLVGCEGTLGIITALTLKLLPAPLAVAGMLAVFEDMVSAMNAVSEIMGKGYIPSAIEFMDYKCLSLVGNMLPVTLPGDRPSILIIEIDGPEDQIQNDIRGIADIAKQAGAAHILPAGSETEREKIWAVRRQVSLEIHDFAPLYVSEDVAVPLTAIADLVDSLPSFEEEYGLTIFAFGHAGDGNIHLNITAPDRDHMDRVEKGITALLARVIEMGGTISGEHGIGLAKKQFLAMELSPKSITLQKGIKNLFDPGQILNPGKIFPE